MATGAASARTRNTCGSKPVPEDFQLPSSYACERSALSVILREPHRVSEYALDERHFHFPAHRTIFRHVLAAPSVESLDLTVFAQRLNDLGELDDIGGTAALADIWTAAPNSAHFSEHVGILRDRLARRLQVLAARHAIDAACDLSIGDYGFLEAIREPFSEVIDAASGANTETTTKELVRQRFEAFRKRCEGEANIQGYPTIPDLDHCLHGIHPGRMWVIGAYPSGGKSVLASQIVTGAALEGVASLFVSLEMSEADVIDRAMIQAARIPAESFTMPLDYAKSQGMSLPPRNHFRAIRDRSKELAEAPFYVFSPARKELSGIEAAIRRHQRDRGVKLVVVDYFQLIRVSGERRRIDELVTASHALQGLLRELDIGLVVLTQLNAEEDTKDARTIEEDADARITILQDRNKNSDSYQQHRGIRIDKDRHYGKGGATLPLVLDRETIRFGPGSIDSRNEVKDEWQ